jgi:hypothetical protein
MPTTENVGAERCAEGKAGLKGGHPQEQNGGDNRGWDGHGVISKAMPRATSHSDQAM